MHSVVASNIQIARLFGLTARRGTDGACIIEP